MLWATFHLLPKTNLKHSKGCKAVKNILWANEKAQTLKNQWKNMKKWGAGGTFKKELFKQLKSSHFNLIWINEARHINGKSPSLRIAHSLFASSGSEKEKRLNIQWCTCFIYLIIHHSILSTQFCIDADKSLWQTKQVNRYPPLYTLVHLVHYPCTLGVNALYSCRNST